MKDHERVFVPDEMERPNEGWSFREFVGNFGRFCLYNYFDGCIEIADAAEHVDWSNKQMGDAPVIAVALCRDHALAFLHNHAPEEFIEVHWSEEEDADEAYIDGDELQALLDAEFDAWVAAMEADEDLDEEYPFNYKRNPDADWLYSDDGPLGHINSYR